MDAWVAKKRYALLNGKGFVGMLYLTEERYHLAAIRELADEPQTETAQPVYVETT